MNLKLEKPIVFFDLETTGLDISKDRIVQIAAIKIKPDGSQEDLNFYVNPCMDIPAEATAVHGITNDDVFEAGRFEEYSEIIYKFFKGCDLGGYNLLRFDIPLLSEEFAKCGFSFPDESVKVIDVQNIYFKKEERTLRAGYKYYMGEELENAHDALADIRATAQILNCQINMYDDIGNTVDKLSEFSTGDMIDFAGKLKKNDKGEICYAFGKWINQPVRYHLDYANWMINQDFFPFQTKQILQKILKEI